MICAERAQVQSFQRDMLEWYPDLEPVKLDEALGRLSKAAIPELRDAAASALSFDRR